MSERQLTIKWTPGKILAVMAGVGWISVQAIVPLYWLIERGFDPKPRQSGWQMYTNMAGGDRFQGINSGVAELEVDNRG